jgi:hypothetical protein
MTSKTFLTCLSISALAASAAYAGLSQAAETEASQPLIVAELFTSQSCSSCPPAEALFSELAEQENLLTLEWHVDYWDTLIHGGSKWKDPYSSEKFTARQRAYNAELRGTRAVYTPQAIINGRLEDAGNRRAAVGNMLASAPELSLPVSIAKNKVTIGGSDAEGDVLFVRLLEKHVTQVKGGENKGRELAGKNIVLEATVLGQTTSNQAEYTLPKVGKGETCAVIVQSLGGKVGPVLGAAKCG